MLFDLPPSTYYERQKALKTIDVQRMNERTKVRELFAASNSSAGARTLVFQLNVAASNQVWCGDITYIWTGDKWSYLAVVIDLYSRRVIGWAMSNSPNTRLTLDALAMAYRVRGKPKGVMFHSDQGCQHGSLEYRQRLWQ